MFLGFLRKGRARRRGADVVEGQTLVSPLSQIEIFTRPLAPAGEADGEASASARRRAVGTGTVADRLPGPGRGRQSGLRQDEP